MAATRKKKVVTEYPPAQPDPLTNFAHLLSRDYALTVEQPGNGTVRVTRSVPRGAAGAQFAVRLAYVEDEDRGPWVLVYGAVTKYCISIQEAILVTVNAFLEYSN